MKNLILILSIFIFGSCTFNPSCPCIVNKVQDINSDGIYYIEYKGLTNAETGGFETTYKHQIGDTIK